jgi:hypothetical protein
MLRCQHLGGNSNCRHSMKEKDKLLVQQAAPAPARDCRGMRAAALSPLSGTDDHGLLHPLCSLHRRVAQRTRLDLLLHASLHAARTGTRRTRVRARLRRARRAVRARLPRVGRGGRRGARVRPARLRAHSARRAALRGQQLRAHGQRRAARGPPLGARRGAAPVAGRAALPHGALYGTQRALGRGC